MRLALAMLLVLCTSPAQTRAAGYVVIANPNLTGTQISQAHMREIFLGAVTRVGGTSVQPVVARSGDAHKLFVAGCLGKTESGLQNYFRTLVFTGKGSPPRSFATAAEIVKYVASTEGAIGYVSLDADLTGVVRLEPK
jgi:ABC-type phosphate transport system substrate-binding protein